MSDTSGTSWDQIKLTPEIILKAYSLGMFPMAKNRYDDELFWVDPEYRGIIPLDNLHISRSLRKPICFLLNTVVCSFSVEFTCLFYVRQTKVVCQAGP